MQNRPRDEVIPEIIAEFSQVFAAAKRRWARYAEEVHPELRSGGILVLQTIMRQGPITTTGLAGMLDLDKAAVSRHVTKLRAFGLVDAQEAESDKRVVLLTASEKARLAIENLQAHTAEEYRARFADWSEHELGQLQALLHRFNVSAEDARGEGPARRCAREHAEGN